MALVPMLFVLKHARVSRHDLEPKTDAVIDHCVKLCRSAKYGEAAAYLMPQLQFSWDWGNADDLPRQFVAAFENFSLVCNDENCAIDVGEIRGDLVLTASVFFNLPCLGGVDLEAFRDWLAENGGWACGHLGMDFDWDYSRWREWDVFPEDLL